MSARSFARVLASAALAFTFGCGPSGQVLDTSSPGEGYAAQCHLWTGRHNQSVKDGKYEPVTVQVDMSSVGETGPMEESALAELLLASEADGTPKLQAGALFARSGLGKTRFAEAVRAQLCGRLPFYLIDAKQAAALTGADNPLIQMMKTRSGGLAPALNKPGARLVVALDGLDEVDLRARGPLLQALPGLLARWPKAQFLVLARPPVAEPDYGLGTLQWKGSLRPLQCVRVEEFTAQKAKNPDERDAFWQFLRRHGLDAKVDTPTSCSYTFLNSYGDIETLLAFVKQAIAPQSQVLVSRTHAHETLLAARLNKELGELGWKLPQALQLLDKMVASAQLRGRSREPRFSLDQCLSATDGLGATSQQRVCEKLFQSPLFRPVDGQYAFSGPDLADLFTGRWLAGLGQNGKDCKAILAENALLQQGSVFTFVVGQPGGQQCLPPLMNARCDLNPKGDVLREFDDGLPAGRARQPMYDALKAGYESIHWKLCAKKTLEGLSGTL